MLFELFNNFYRAYSLRLLFTLPRKIVDRATIYKIHSLVFTKISLIIQCLSESISSTPDDYLTSYDNNHGLNSVMGIMSDYIACKDFGINNEFVEAFDTYWETSKEVHEYIYLEPKKYSWDFEYGRDNWRKLISLQINQIEKDCSIIDPEILRQKLSESDRSIRDSIMTTISSTK